MSAPKPFEVAPAAAVTESGDPAETRDLLLTIYDELNRLAAERTAARPGGEDGASLDVESLVHEAYLGLIGQAPEDHAAHAPEGSGRFFTAAAEAMRRLLVKRAHARTNHLPAPGGGRARVSIDEIDIADDDNPAELLAVDDAVSALEAHDRRLAEIVKLRYFSGLSIPRAAAAMGMEPRELERQWGIARNWLFESLTGEHRPRKPAARH